MFYYLYLPLSRPREKLGHDPHLQVLAMAAGYPVLETLLLDNLQKSNGLATIFKSGKKYISASTPLCLELLSTLANLFYCRTLRDLVFGKDKVDQSYNTVEWVISLMEENGVQDVDVVLRRPKKNLTYSDGDSSGKVAVGVGVSCK